MLLKKMINKALSPNVKHGFFYNFYAATDVRGIAPTGWHVPTIAEFQTLIDYANANFGTSLSGGKSLAGKTEWTADGGTNVIGNNLSLNNYNGFSAYPTGVRYFAGEFIAIAIDGAFWTSTISGADARNTGMNNGGTTMTTQTNRKVCGLSVRLIRDSGNTARSFYDIDGNYYTSVTIGTQTWAVQNLATTKYVDGSSIPNVTVQATWVGLATGAYCAYNNSNTNVFL